MREVIRRPKERNMNIHHRILFPAVIIISFLLLVSSSPAQTVLADQNSTRTQSPLSVGAVISNQRLTGREGNAANQDLFTSYGHNLIPISREVGKGHAPVNSPPADLYSPAQRWGYGLDRHGPNNTTLSLGDLNYTAINGALFQNWWSEDFKAPYPGLDYYPMVGLLKVFTKLDCVLLADIVNNHPERYPDGTRWVVGNEIGFDLPISPQDYATHFRKWRNCLKKIAADHQITYLVGSGSILSERIILPGRAGACATTLDYQNGSNYSGYAYWKTYLTILKTNYPTQLPDFYTAHGFTYCAPNVAPGNTGWWNVPYFQQEIKDYRLLMKQLGVQKKELIINEFGPLYADPQANVTTADYLKYLCDTTTFMLKQTDTALGNPRDGNRYVQRWMWFNLNAGATPGNRFPALALLTTSNALTKLGKGYNALVQQTPSNCGTWANNFH